jgi:hypothetical protein
MSREVISSFFVAAKRHSFNLYDVHEDLDRLELIQSLYLQDATIDCPKTGETYMLLT